MTPADLDDLDELDVGHDPRWTPPWRSWGTRRRTAAASALAALLLVAGGGWLVLRPEPAAAPPRAVLTPNVAAAPGADVVVTVAPDPTRCPAGARCDTDAAVTPGLESALRSAFPSVGYLGRQRVADADSGEVYYQYLRFTTGTLVTVTLTQQPVRLLPEPPVTDMLPSARDLDSGSLDLTTVRDGYLMTALVAGLPGQTLPVNSARRWLETVPAPNG